MNATDLPIDDYIRFRVRESPMQLACLTKMSKIRRETGGYPPIKTEASTISRIAAVRNVKPEQNSFFIRISD